MALSMRTSSSMTAGGSRAFKAAGGARINTTTMVVRPMQQQHQHRSLTTAAPFVGGSRSRSMQQLDKQRSVVARGLFGLGVPELVVIAGVAALIFGPSKLPELGKGLGKTVKSFQTAAKEFETELKQATADDPKDGSKDGEGGKKAE